MCGRYCSLQYAECAMVDTIGMEDLPSVMPLENCVDGVSLLEFTNVYLYGRWRATSRDMSAKYWDRYQASYRTAVC